MWNIKILLYFYINFRRGTCHSSMSNITKAFSKFDTAYSYFECVSNFV